MSSRFVSGGTVGPDPDESGAGVAAAREPLAKNKDSGGADWATVQRQLDEERKQREAQRVGAAPEQSLYDILQANKAAKQAAFEEKTKLKNQFRSLDDDEIEFLDEVRARERKEEERVRKETEEGLRTFRRMRQHESSVETNEGEQELQQQQNEDDEDWAAVGGRKRKRAARESYVVKGIKRKNNGEEEEEKKTRSDEPSNGKEEEKGEKKEAVAAQPKKGPSLVAYDSDDDE